MSKQDHPSKEKGYYYSVLNLPRSASEQEIRERYRSLSVIFHPDKQRDDRTKETASQKFLEIQKAYEVLSDPFLRTVYDVLGEEGLGLDWSDEYRYLSPSELRQVLLKDYAAVKERRLETMIRPKGRLTCGVDASSLFDDLEYDVPWYKEWLDRLSDVRVSNLSLRHTFQKVVNERTRLVFGGRLSRQRAEVLGTKRDVASGNVFGTVRHQWSPRLEFEATALVLRPQALSLKSTYNTLNSQLEIQAPLSFAILCSPSHVPPLTVTFSRRLWKDSLTQGVISASTGPQPYFSLNFIKPGMFNFTPTAFPPVSDSDDDSPVILSVSPVSAFLFGTHYWSYGFTLSGLASALRAEWAVTFRQLAVRLKAGVQIGLLGGLGWVLSGAWLGGGVDAEDGGEKFVEGSVGAGVGGVWAKLDFIYHGQRVIIPISLTDENNPKVALWTTVVPCTALVAAWWWILEPGRRVRHAQMMREAKRRMSDENSEARRQYEDSVSLLKETARRHVESEKQRDGLVILEATYGPAEESEETKGLDVDVTVPLQALVRDSLLHIPGDRTKAGIQGFYDPAPFLAKLLRIRYMFGGRMHYAEIPDWRPVVLPLQDHLVE